MKVRGRVLIHFLHVDAHVIAPAPPPHAMTNAGSLRFPRCGTGARNGLSVSVSSRSSGTSRAVSRRAPALWNVMMPGKRDVEAEVEAGPRQVGGAAEAVQHAAQLALAFLSQHRHRVLVGLPRVNHDRAASARAPAALARERPSAARRAASNRSDSRDRFRRPREPAASARSGRARWQTTRSVFVPYSCAAWGWMPTAVRTSGQSSWTRRACVASCSLPASRMTSARSSPRLARAANDAFEIRAEGFVGQMAVRVDHRSPDGSRGDRRRSAKTSQRLAGCETTPPCASTYSFTRSFPRL